MIRPTRPDDIPTLVTMADATGLFKPLEIEALQEVLDDYFAANQAAGHWAITLEENGELLGFAYYAPAPMTDRSWYLYWIVVRKDQQGQGRGACLIDFLEAEIRRLKGRVLFVETGSLPHYERTRQFYRKLGYEQHALLKDFYTAGDSMVVFRKALDLGESVEAATSE